MTAKHNALARTPLYDLHREAGARLVPFAGYEMPVQFSGIIAEHLHTRAHAGLFDVSHMGQVRLSGAGAAAALESLVPADIVELAPGRQRYALFTNDSGGILDDLMVTNAGDHLFLVVNAACKQQDLAHLRRHLGRRCEIDELGERALLALQGPQAVEALARLAPAVRELSFMHSAAVEVSGAACYVSRSGYTGEDGFELFVAAEDAGRVWDALLDAGTPLGLLPIGLGARDTLRLEAGMPLYGNELDRSTNPVEAGLGRVLRLDKDGGFVGRDALARVVRDGPSKRLVGLVVEGRGIARHGYPVLAGDRRTGVVTSGAPSPTLGIPIAMAYVAPGDAEPGTMLDVEIRDRRVPARVVELPFYRRKR